MLDINCLTEFKIFCAFSENSSPPLVSQAGYGPVHKLVQLRDILMYSKINDSRKKYKITSIFFKEPINMKHTTDFHRGDP